MASKLFAPFKKFPQQLPIFRKSTDKFKDVSMSNYNSVYGTLDDITCNCFDNNLYLLALGTNKGEIKIYGSPGTVYTLVNSPLKSLNFIKFLDGQGRIISINNENDLVLWEYKIELSIWEMISSLSLSTHLLNGKVTSMDVSQSFSWKSDSDDLLELLLIGSNTNKILQILIVGNRFHLYEGDDLTIDSEHLLSKCQDLDKDYEFGGVNQITFHPINNEKFFVSYKNGLILIMEIKFTKEKLEEARNEIISDFNKINNEFTENKNNEEKLEIVNEVVEKDMQLKIDEDNKSPETTEMFEDNTIKENEQEKCELEKGKAVEEILKVDELKTGIKKLKESIQVPYANVQKPIIMHYVLSNKKLISTCWADNIIVTVSENSNNVNLYEIGLENFKLEEPSRIISLAENFQTIASKFTYFNLRSDNIGIFLTTLNEKQNVLVLMKNDKLYTDIETPSHIIDYILVKGQKSDSGAQIQPNILLILCESQLIAVDLECDNLSEIQCPYLALKNTSHITSLTSIVQAPVLIFPNTRTLNEIFNDWPLKSGDLPNEKSDEDTSIDIFGTGHADGSINIWQVMQSGVLSLLIKVESSDLFINAPKKMDSSTNLSFSRKRIGYYIKESEDNLLQITNLQLILHCTNSISDSSSNELFCVAGNAIGTVFIFKYDGSDNKEPLIEIFSEFDRENITWLDSEAPELLEKSNISNKMPKLNYIVKLNPSLPITALAFQPVWELLAVGCTHGFVLFDFRQNKCVFSHLTIHRTSKNLNVIQPQLSVGQQLKKSIRQSFRKLKKLKPATKHTYTVNEEKAKDKEEPKLIEKENDKEIAKPDDEDDLQKDHRLTSEYLDTNEENVKEEVKDHIDETDNTVITTENNVDNIETELTTIEITRKDRPATTVGSLLIVNTSLTSSNKLPCLFAGTNIGSIYAFELSFEDDNVTVKLSKELHLQHKAPILLLTITNSNHVPLLGTVDQIGTYERKFKNTDETKLDDDKPDEEINCDSVQPEVEVGPSGDTDNKDDTKQKSGTLPSPVVQEEAVEQTDGARRSVDSSKEKINLSNANMKKSGTLPASFLQAIGKSQGSTDCHELLVVSEEQVKLFSLPSLKAKYKYKVVDTGHHFSHSKTLNSQEIEQSSQEKKTENMNAEIQNEALSSKTVIRRISSVGLCKVHGLKSTGNKWSVSIALTNGELIALNINNLKKYFSNVFNYSNNPILAGISNGELNLITSYANKYNIQVTDFSQGNVHRYESSLPILIPKYARPVINEKVEVELKVNESFEKVKEESIEIESVINGHHEIVNGHEEEEKDQMGDEAVVQNTNATHHGDITMDSIKEYITNVDGNVTIKTFESSKEKQINVDGGQIVTTIHEKQIKDGEIIKDDVVKITSDTRASHEILLKE